MVVRGYRGRPVAGEGSGLNVTLGDGHDGSRTGSFERTCGTRVSVMTKPGNAGGAKGSREMEGVTNKPTEATPAIVPLAQQAGAIPAEWLWVKPCAWTIRMLTALITGVKEQKWFRLIDKVFAERNLWAAFQQVAEKKGAAGVDHVTVEQFGKQLPDSIWELSDQLKAGTYRPQAVRREIGRAHV